MIQLGPVFWALASLDRRPGSPVLPGRWRAACEPLSPHLGPLSPMVGLGRTW